MALKIYKPTTPGVRGMTGQDFSMITAKKPASKKLLVMLKSNSGRNNQGRITTRHQGGGAKRFYRVVNFNLPAGTIAKVVAIEYDPYRSARIARIVDQYNVHHYVLADSNMKVGLTISCGQDIAIEASNRLKLKDIPTGTTIYNIELKPGQGGKLVRSAGNSAQLISKEGGVYAQVRMPSAEVRLVLLECYASIGVVGNEQHQNINYGKAGRSRKRGIRPGVRGVVMNAVDHPHGGGDGGRHGTGKHPRTPWGVKTLGYKTRSRKITDKFIVKSRHKAKRK
jgi:large subunit ribosomal protein L2